MTALGFGAETSFAGLLAGLSGIGTTADAAPDSGCGLAAFVPPPSLRAEPPDELRTQVKFLNGAGELAAQVAHEAHGRADWAGSDVPPEECGLWLSQMDTWDWPASTFGTRSWKRRRT